MVLLAIVVFLNILAATTLLGVVVQRQKQVAPQPVRIQKDHPVSRNGSNTLPTGWRQVH